MNKKIYFENKFLAFESDTNNSKEEDTVKNYGNSSEKTLSLLIPQFLDKSNPDSFRLSFTGNWEETLKILKKSFTYIEAAGGFIEKENEFLFIHRHGRWDLPKGKREKEETIENTAIRECEEECGVKKLKIIKPLPSTFHLYEYKSGYALKQTFWFYMATGFSQALTPQLEEDIDQVKWFTKQQIESIVLKDTYFTISDTIHAGLYLNP